MVAILKLLLGCYKGGYKRIEEDEVGDILLVIYLNNVCDLQTASCSRHSPM
jgi:hypothetical protein